MIKPPHCENVKPSPLASWLCAWWDWIYIGIGECGQIVYFCSRPAWEQGNCETQGLRLMPQADSDDDGEID